VSHCVAALADLPDAAEDRNVVVTDQAVAPTLLLCGSGALSRSTSASIRKGTYICAAVWAPTRRGVAESSVLVEFSEKL
jgi:hypothetical protein